MFCSARNHYVRDCPIVMEYTLGARGHLPSRPMVSVLKQFTCPIPSRSMVSTFKKYPPVCPNFIHQVHGEYFLKVLTMDLLGIGQANCFRTHNELTMGLLGKCPLTPSDIDKHWVIRNSEGKITLPSGYFVPSNIRGANMRKRVDKYWSTGPACESDFVKTHFLEGPDEYVFSVDVDVNHDPDSSTSDKHRALEDFGAQADSVQAWIDELRGAQVLAIEKGKSKYEFSGVEILKRNVPPSSSSSVHHEFCDRWIPGGNRVRITGSRLDGCCLWSS